MKSSNQVSPSSYEMGILVGRKPIIEFLHEGMTFIEGRNGSEYKIRIRNNTYRRACFVVSVDGLSVLDGKNAADGSPGYVLGSHETLDITCYKVDDATGAKFVFGTKDQSYSAEIGKGTDNTGVIAVKVFAEKQRQYIPPVTIATSVFPTRRSKSSKIIGSSGVHHANNGPVASSAGGMGGWGLASYNSRGAVERFGSTSEHELRAMPRSFQEDEARLLPCEAGLGTVFGTSTEWKTTQVTFEREPTSAAQMVIYYDNKKGLERRGVKMEQKVVPLPNPFPGDVGCETPHGWRK